MTSVPEMPQVPEIALGDRDNFSAIDALGSRDALGFRDALGARMPVLGISSVFRYFSSESVSLLNVMYITVCTFDPVC
jgi:hypothetical protein